MQWITIGDRANRFVKQQKQTLINAFAKHTFKFETADKTATIELNTDISNENKRKCVDANLTSFAIDDS